jgi:hypothetical protein
MALVITYEEQLGLMARGLYWWVFGSGGPPS